MSLALVTGCSECGAEVEQVAGPGRRRMTCSEACQKARTERIAASNRIAREQASHTLRDRIAELRLTLNEMDPSEPDFDRLGRAAWHALAGIDLDVPILTTVL